MKKIQEQKLKDTRLAYAGFLFRTFIKRPFGYVIPLLFVLYLSVILIIVPKVMHFQPLFVWTVGGFNMPVFNLYFIAASAAALAVCIFRTGREDGTDLNLSAKPLTKGSAVAMKTLVFIVIMFAFSALALVVAAIVLPIFGQYNEATNPTGITLDKYRALILSILFGNFVNMLLFGGIAVLITMVGGQVITMIGSIGIVFLMCLMNFLYPNITTTPLDVMTNRYNTEILSYSCNTLAQYENTNNSIDPIAFATVQCSTDISGDEKFHLDTKETWDACKDRAKTSFINYIDFARQLSSLYSSFGLDSTKLGEAAKLSIGMNNSFVYSIDEKTHITNNIESKNYPIAIYTSKSSQGLDYPVITIIGGDTGVSSSNWYARSAIFSLDFNSTNYISTSPTSMLITDDVWELYHRPYSKISDVRLTAEQTAKIPELYDYAFNKFGSALYLSNRFPVVMKQAIREFGEANPGLFWDKNTLYKDLKPEVQHSVIAKIHFALAVEGQTRQIDRISTYTGKSFPFNSKTLKEWFGSLDKEDEKQKFTSLLFNSGIQIGNSDDAFIYDRLVTSRMDYAETYNNLYQYSVKPAYDITTVATVWSCVSVLFFTSSIIVYKKTDFK